MGDVTQAVGIVLMVAAFSVGATCVGVMVMSQAWGHAAPEQEFFWDRHADEIEAAGRWSFWIFCAGLALSLVSKVL